MKTEKLVWLILFVVGGVCLLYRAGFSERGMGKAFVTVEEVKFAPVEKKPAADAAPGAEPEIEWVKIGSDRAKELNLTADKATKGWTALGAASQRDFSEATAADANQTKFQFSQWRTIGIWVGAFFTLAIFSFLYRDNPFYKVAESMLVGISAAYWMVVGFWDVIVPNLMGRLVPLTTKHIFLPGLDGKDLEPDFWYLVPLVLGVMLLWRLAPKGNWIARWPLAFIIGTTAGIRLTGFIHADFLSQIRNSIVSFYEKTQVRLADGSLAFMPSGEPMMAFNFWASLANVILVVGVLVCLVYFFFSFEHKGIVGKTARVGIWFLMVTFGAAFGYTVMGRIALLAIRLEFLFDDWLWLIDPTGKRAVAAATGFLWHTVGTLF